MLHARSVRRACGDCGLGSDSAESEDHESGEYAQDDDHDEEFRQGECLFSGRVPRGFRKRGPGETKKASVQQSAWRIYRPGRFDL